MGSRRSAQKSCGITPSSNTFSKFFIDVGKNGPKKMLGGKANDTKSGEQGEKLKIFKFLTRTALALSGIMGVVSISFYSGEIPCTLWLRHGGPGSDVVFDIAPIVANWRNRLDPALRPRLREKRTWRHETTGGKPRFRKCCHDYDENNKNLGEKLRAKYPYKKMIVETVTEWLPIVYRWLRIDCVFDVPPFSCRLEYSPQRTMSLTAHNYSLTTLETAKKTHQLWRIEKNADSKKHLIM